jgi:hypothetical protein
MCSPYDKLTVAQRRALEKMEVPEIYEFGHDKHGEGYRISSGMRWCQGDTMPRRGRSTKSILL